MSTYQPGDRTPVTSFSQLTDYFAPGAPAQGRVGVEWELLPVDRLGRLVPYAGPSGVEPALIRLAPGHEPLLESGHITAIKLHDGGVVGLEPGGQVELASPPLESLAGIEAFMERSLRRLETAIGPSPFTLAPWGVAPANGEEDLPDVPKARYVILKEHLLHAGTLGRRMMKLTASVQVSLDYRDEAEMSAMIGTLLPVLPYAVAFFANGPVYRGRKTRSATGRSAIWRHTDPRRCGLPAFLFKVPVRYAGAARWALGRPLLLLVREGRFLPGDGRSFEAWLKAPGPLGPMTMEDWDLHVSTLFPDIRLRNYLEVRVLDSVPLPLVLAAAAFFKGLLCGPRTPPGSLGLPLLGRAAAGRAILAAGRLGPRWMPEAGPSPSEAMARLLDAAGAGLQALGEEDRLLEPLRRLVQQNRCPASGWARDRQGHWHGPGLRGGAFASA